MKNLKAIFFFFFLMVMDSFKANAFKDVELPSALVNSDSSWWNTMTETRESLAIGDSIMLIGFLLWIAYIVFCMPKNTLKKM